METILLVEDEENILRGLERNLRYEGYQVITAADGEEGLELAVDKRPDLIVLDVMLPVVNGFDVCRTLRRSGLDVPIIMLTAKSQEMDKIIGFDMGADDYVTKPFSVRELVARINAMLRRRRVNDKTADTYRFGAFEVDVRGKALYEDGDEVPLSKTEFDLLLYFLKNEGAAATREEILNRVWGFDYAGTPRTVDNFINKLRMKIEEDPDAPRYVLTVRGVGYKFTDPDKPDQDPPRAANREAESDADADDAADTDADNDNDNDDPAIEVDRPTRRRR